MKEKPEQVLDVLSLDIDGTQYSFAHPEWDQSSTELAAYLTERRAENALFLIHNTGRPYPWTAHDDNQRYLNPIIAEGDAIISHAGTVIWLPPFDKPWQEWHDHVCGLVDPETVDKLKEELKDQGIVFHPETEENEFKICCFVDPKAQNESVVTIQNYLDQHYQGKFEVFYWNSETLDITPKGANKDDALKFLLERKKLSSKDVLVAGDSLNDLPVLKNESYKRVLVGNAMPGIKDALSSQSGVFVASINQPAAKGVLAGIKHFQDLSQASLEPERHSRHQRPIIG